MLSLESEIVRLSKDRLRAISRFKLLNLPQLG